MLTDPKLNDQNTTTTTERPCARRTLADAEIGDSIVAEFPGGAQRRGLIQASFGRGVHRHFTVLWNDSHQSLFYPDPFHTRVIRAGDDD